MNEYALNRQQQIVQEYLEVLLSETELNIGELIEEEAKTQSLIVSAVTDVTDIELSCELS